MKNAEKLSDQVIIRIQQDIAQGKFKPGEKMPAEPELMKIYEVGRSTIREAIKTLAVSGVLKVKQGFGTVVNLPVRSESLHQRLRRADFDEINSVRRVLEKELVRLAAIHRTEEDIVRIKKCLQEKKKKILDGNHDQSADADIAFHLAIACSSANLVLTDLYQDFTQMIRDFFTKRQVNNVDHFASNYKLHVSLFRAIKNKKPKLAERALENILDQNY